jgi:hypothetical protein
MRPDDYYQKLRQRPFEPVLIHVSDGTVYEIRHPDLVMVGRSTILVGTPALGFLGPVFERYDTVSLLHITRLEPLTPSAPAGSPSS